MDPSPDRPRKPRFSLGQMMAAVAVLAVFMAFFASIRRPEIILLMLAWGAGY